MIYIVSGSINTGKTSWLLKEFNKYRSADGFACRKVRVNGEHIGYELVHLKTGEVCQFIRKIDYIPRDWNEAFRLGIHYSFNREGLAFAKKIANDALSSNADCFFLDEVGHLELKGQGFADILKSMLMAGIDMVIVVREALVEKIVDTFGIGEYKIIIPEF